MLKEQIIIYLTHLMVVFVRLPAGLYLAYMLNLWCCRIGSHLQYKITLSKTQIKIIVIPIAVLQLKVSVSYNYNKDGSCDKSVAD